jgi:O-antigen ligase
VHALSIAWYERGLRQRVTGVIPMALAAVIGIALAYHSPNPSFKGAFAAVGIFAISAWMLTSAKTHVTLALLMVYLAVADGVIKNVSGSPNATLGRDLLLYAIAIGILLKKVHRGEPFDAPPLTGWIVAFVAVVAVQLANPANESFSHSLASVRPHLEFVPLFFLGHSVMRSRRRIKAFLIILVAVCAMNGVAGLVQFSLSPSQLASWGPGYASKIEGTDGLSPRGFVDSSGQSHPRPFALGADEGFGGIMGLLAAPAAFAILSLAGNRRLKIVAGLLAVGIALAVVTSQARVAIVGAVLSILAFMLLATSSRRLFRLGGGLAIGLTIAYIAISALTSGSNSHLFDRYTSIAPDKVVNTSVSYRSDTFGKSLPKYLANYPLGAGIGKTGPAANSAGGTGGKGLNAESEPNYAVLELGIPGLVLLIGFQLRLLTMSIGIRRLKDIELRLLLAALAAPLFALFAMGWVGITTATTPGSPYLWFVGGVLTYWLITLRQRPRDARHAV